MARMPGSADKARQDMIARMKNAWQSSKPNIRQDDDHTTGARSKSSKEARDNMIARMTGKPIKKQGTGAYREDSADHFDCIFDRAWDNAMRKVMR